MSMITANTTAALLRVPPAPTPMASPTVAACLNACLPVYAFPERVMDAPAPKLPRVDSIPSVPDYFAEPRCNSPVPLRAGQLGFGRCDSIDSFNDLPLDIDASVHHLLSSDCVVTKPLPYNLSGIYLDDMEMYGKIAASRPAAAHAAGRHLPRRHASDVMRPGGSRGSLDGDISEVPNRSLLATTLMSMWEERAGRPGNLFRYDVTQCATRVLPGGLGFVAQLNQGRATMKRPTEFTADRVLQRFDPAKFNFKKAALAEALLAFHPAAAAAAPRLLAPSAPLAEAAAVAGAASPHLVLINVSPIDYGHVLLLPRVLEQLPQALDGGSVLLALQFAREMGSPSFRVGYNSLGAYGTINHLHFHTYHMSMPMPCERAPTELLPGRLAAPRVPGAASAPPSLHKRRFSEYFAADDGAAAAGVCVSRLLDYPVNGFVVESASAGCDAAEGRDLAAVAAVVGAAAERMQAANQPFNLLVCDAGRRVFVFPQCYAERQAAGVVPADLLDTGVNPASFEIGGHLVLKRGEDYEVADEAWAARLLAAVSLDEGRFMEVAAMCFGDGGGTSC